MCRPFLVFTHKCVYLVIMSEDKKKYPSEYRIKFAPEEVSFLHQYKEVYGASIQWFVEKSVKKEIQELKLKMKLGELPHVI